MVADSHITHCFYVIDSIPIDQKIILGMDFLTDHLASIDIPKREVTLDKSPMQAGICCRAQDRLRLPPRKILRINLLAQSSVEPTCKVGYLHSVNNLPDGCIVWHGVQERRNDHIATYISNQSDRDMEFELN